jgi:hypothetical protein
MGCQNFLERCLMADLKAVAHIYVIQVSFGMRKFKIAQKTAPFVPLLKLKSFEV